MRGLSEPAGGSAIASPEQALRERLAKFVSLDGLADLPVAAAREVYDRETAIMFGPVEELPVVQDRTVEGAIRVRIYRPPPARRGTLVYFHGGGWVVGSLESHDGVARFLCRHAGCNVVAVNYRHAPEHRFPAALEDAWAATRWASREMTGPLAVGGDSSGGNLAAVVARWARDANLALALQLLVYPALDLRAEGELANYWKSQYLGSGDEAPRDPNASPLLAEDLRGVAPALLQSCGRDTLVAQASRYEARLRQAGVAVEHRIYPDLIHGAYRMPGVLDGARKMLDDSAAALAGALAAK